MPLANSLLRILKEMLEQHPNNRERVCKGAKRERGEMGERRGREERG
jgi:hypothetical protein